ncbi:amidase [Catenulispora sp. MAP5-51]|uniref:amidase n=1 Tax=Catenulispora sp. MAP5-51 TaxID=3156298 RepID=UPI003512883D
MAGWTGSGVEPRTAAEIAAAVRQGKSSVRGAVQEALDRIAAADPRIGAFRKVRHDAALSEADEVAARPDLADLPLAGVPVAVKDNVAVADEQCRHGTAATADRPPEPEDHPVVARLRAAGAVVVGLTHTPELSLVAMTDSALGMARNPWDPARTPGGSSGGAAAAVAAGLVPVAHGNDGLGSIRGPAACCGLFGFKPGLGTVPSGLGRDSWWGLAENGPLATTVEDAALMLSVMAGDPALAAAPNTRPSGLRIAVSTAPTSRGYRVDREHKDTVESVAKVLEEAGHTVVEARGYPQYLGFGAVQTWYAAAAMDAGEYDRRALDRATRRMASAGRTLAKAGLNGARTRRKWRDRDADRFLGDADVVLTPTLLRPPPEAVRWGRRGLLSTFVANTSYAGLCPPWNLAGWPAMNVPAGTHSCGMPIGVQFAARRGQEALLLGLAAYLEAVRPWPRTAPMGVVGG